MKKLFLHIGMHKTGSSALQQALFQGREGLKPFGVYYLDYQENHSAPFFSLFSAHPEKYHLNRRNGITTRAQADEHNRLVERDLRVRLAAAPDGITVISGEDISLLQRSRLPALQAFLADYFDAVAVVGYARSPYAFANAYAVQALRGGTPIRDQKPEVLAPNYQWRFQKFLDTFGSENVRLRPYHPALLPDNCIVSAFLKEMGAPEKAYEALSIRRINRQLSQEAGALLNHVNQRNHDVADPQQKKRPSTAFLAAISKLEGPNFRLPADLAHQVRDHIAWDVRWMTRNFTGTVDTDLWDDTSMFDEPGPDLTADPAALERLLADLPPA